MMPALRQVGRAAKEISNAAAKDGAAASKATQDLGMSLPSMPKMDWVSNAKYPLCSCPLLTTRAHAARLMVIVAHCTCCLSVNCEEKKFVFRVRG